MYTAKNFPFKCHLQWFEKIFRVSKNHITCILLTCWLVVVIIFFWDKKDNLEQDRRVWQEAFIKPSPSNTLKSWNKEGILSTEHKKY